MPLFLIAVCVDFHWNIAEGRCSLSLRLRLRLEAQPLIRHLKLICPVGKQGIGTGHQVSFQLQIAACSPLHPRWCVWCWSWSKNASVARMSGIFDVTGECQFTVLMQAKATDRNPGIIFCLNFELFAALLDFLSSYVWYFWHILDWLCYGIFGNWYVVVFSFCLACHHLGLRNSGVTARIGTGSWQYRATTRCSFVSNVDYLLSAICTFARLATSDILAGRLGLACSCLWSVPWFSSELADTGSVLWSHVEVARLPLLECWSTLGLAHARWFCFDFEKDLWNVQVLFWSCSTSLRCSRWRARPRYLWSARPAASAIE